ncbi:MAG: DEAD/DEAH box helicase family protein, partial [Endomicrobia bacterium]|nr:DEAD/DEAH box helicase family protein [Endomicrobiia bacterium]
GKRFVGVVNGEFVAKDPTAGVKIAKPEKDKEDATGEQPPLPEVATRGVIDTTNREYYLVRGDGNTSARVSIRGAQMVVIGVGTTFLTGSRLEDGSIITKGSLVMGADGKLRSGGGKVSETVRIIDGDINAQVTIYNEYGISASYFSSDVTYFTSYNRYYFEYYRPSDSPILTWESVTNGVRSVWDGITNMINNPQTIVDAFNSAGKAIGDFFTGAGKAISDWAAGAGKWLEENWQGLATSAGVGAATGAAIGAAGLGIGALAGAIVGGIMGVVSYIVGNQLSGGKGGGFTGNQIIDGAINGALGGLSVLNVGALAARLSGSIAVQLTSKLPFLAKTFSVVGSSVKAVSSVISKVPMVGSGATSLSTRISTSIVGKLVYREIALHIATRKGISSYNNFAEGRYVEGLVDLASAIAAFSIPKVGLVQGISIIFSPTNAYLAVQDFKEGDVLSGIGHTALAALPFISGPVNLFGRVTNSVDDVAKGSVSVATRARNFFLPMFSGVNSLRSALPIIGGGVTGAVGSSVYALSDGKFDGLKDAAIIAGGTLGGMILGSAARDIVTNIRTGINSFASVYKTGGMAALGSKIWNSAQLTATNTLRIMGSMVAFNVTDLAMYKTLGFSPGVALGLIDPNVSFEKVVVGTFTDPKMLAFAVGASLGWSVFNPVISRIPVLGPTIRWMADRGGFYKEGGKVSNWLDKTPLGRVVNHYTRFLWEEGVQERPIEYGFASLQNLGIPIPHTLSEVVQEAADRRGAGRFSRTNIASASSQISATIPDFFTSVDRINNVGNSNILQNVVRVVNNLVLQQGIQNVSIEVVQAPKGAEVLGSVKIVDNTIPAVPVVVAEISFNNAKQLKDILLSISGASANRDVDLNSFVQQVRFNYDILNNNSDLGLHRLSSEQKVDFLAGMSVFSGVEEVVNNNGRIDIDKVNEYVKALNTKELSNLVVSVTPVIELIRDKNENNLRTKLHTVMTSAVDKLIENVTSKPSLENISSIVNITDYILNSNLNENEKVELGTKLLTNLATVVNNYKFTTSVTKESPVELQQQYEKTLYDLLPQLNSLAYTIVNTNNTVLYTLFSAVLSSNPQLKQLASAYSSILQVQQDTLPNVLSNIINSLRTQKIEPVLRLIEKTENVKTKLVLFNLLSTLYAEKVKLGITVDNEAVNESIAKFEKFVNENELTQQQKYVVADTVAKFNFVVGVEEGSGVSYKGLEGFVEANKNIYDTSKDRIGQYYGKVVKIDEKLNTLIVDAKKEYDRLKPVVGEEQAGQKVAEAVIPVIEQRIRSWLGNEQFKLNPAQRDAISKILKEMFKEAEQHRYTHILQTGGGKTFIAVVSALLLRVQTPTSQFVSVFTNTIDNAKDVYNHLVGIFGKGLGEVVVITADDLQQATNNPQLLRQKLQNASIVVTTYDIWSGIVAQTFSKLLDKNTEVGKRVISLLSKNGIRVAEDNNGKVQFEEPTQAREAANIIIENGIGLDGPDLILPLERIGSAVADEIDFFSTIPMQALAVSMGKYYTSSRFVEYYKEVLNLQSSKKVSISDIKKLAEKYADMGIDISRVSKDVKLNVETINNLINLYSEVGKMVNNGSSEKEIIKNVSSSLQQLKESISEEQVRSDINQLVVNRKAVEYFVKLKDVTESLYRQSNPYKGEIKIDGRTVKLSDIWKYGSKSLIDEIMNITVDENVEVEKLKDRISAEVKQEVDLKLEIAKVADQLYKEYGKLFSKQEIIEHLWNGIGAHGMKEGREYYVKDGRVWVTNLGRGVENLTLPAGMMQVLEAKHNVEISKPNRETYISNSVFAMSLFKDIIGLTGTVSSGVETSVLKRMGFEKDGSAPKVESHWRLFNTQKGMIKFIYQATQLMNSKGIANFNLILTPDSSISKTAYDVLVELGVNPAEIKLVDGSVSDKELDMLRDEVKQGKYKFVIADAYLLGRGWNVGKMLEAANILKEQQQATSDKVQATLWLLEPHLMTETQMLQSAGRIDPFGNNRFDTSLWTKDIISLVSVETAREVKTLREAAKNNSWNWSLDIIVDNIHKVQLENEEEALRKAGQKIVVSAQQGWVEQHKQSPPQTVEVVENDQRNDIEKTDRNIASDVINNVKQILNESFNNNPIAKLVEYMLIMVHHYEQHKKFEEEVKLGWSDVVKSVVAERNKMKVAQVKSVMFKKDSYEIMFYEVDSEQQAKEDLNKYQQIKQVLSDKVVRFATTYKKLDDGRWVVILVKEKTDTLETKQDYLKDVAEIQIALWRNKMYDCELNKENWKNNYGVTSDGRVVLRNPAVVVIHEGDPREVVEVNDEVALKIKGGILDYWGQPKGPHIDPLGIGTVASLLVDNLRKGGMDIRDLPKLIRGAA